MFFKSLILIMFTISLPLNAMEFTYKNIGKILRNETKNFPNGGKYVSILQKGGFETSIGKYGSYECDGNMFYNKKLELERMLFVCELIDQDGDKFYVLASRDKGSDIDRALGLFSIIDGEGYWKDFIGTSCTYAVTQVIDTVFASAKCKKE